jgi:hypothetical protein
MYSVKKSPSTREDRGRIMREYTGAGNLAARSSSLGRMSSACEQPRQKILSPKLRFPDLVHKWDGQDGSIRLSFYRRLFRVQMTHCAVRDIAL